MPDYSAGVTDAKQVVREWADARIRMLLAKPRDLAQSPASLEDQIVLLVEMRDGHHVPVGVASLAVTHGLTWHGWDATSVFAVERQQRFLGAMRAYAKV